MSATPSSTSVTTAGSFPVDRLLLAGCLTIALVLRLVMVSIRADQLTIDRDAYLGIAKSVADGRGFSSPDSTTPTAFRPPLYPICLAAGMKLFSVAAVVAAVNIIAGLGSVWLTAAIGAHLQLGRLRFVAALLVAVDPLLLQYSVQPMTESVCTFLVAFWLWCVTMPQAANGRSSILSSTLTGASFGLLVLSRPTFWVVAGICGLIWLLQLRDVARRKAMCMSALTTAAGTLIVVAPWVVRNTLVMGSPILMTTHGGYTLLLGNNPVFYEQVVQQPFGTIWPDASQKGWEAELETRMSSELGPNASELSRDAWQSRLAKSYITAQPGLCIQAGLHRIRSLWNTVPQIETRAGLNPVVIIAVDWFYRIELLLGSVGLILVMVRPKRMNWAGMLVLIVSLQTVHLLYWTNARMRAPLTPAIVLLAVVPFASRRRAT